MLDRNRYYAVVYGDPVAKALQDGQFYRGDGTPVNSEEPAKPQSKPQPKAAVVSQGGKPSPAKKERIEALQALHISKLKPMAIKVSKADGITASLPAMKGKGLKARLVAYIADNTE